MRVQRRFHLVELDPVTADLNLPIRAADEVQHAAAKVADKIRKMGVHELSVKVRGPGSGRESAIRALSSAGIEIKEDSCLNLNCRVTENLVLNDGGGFSYTADFSSRWTSG